MITLRVDALWDSNKKITYTMLGGFFVTYSATVIFLILAAIDLWGAYNPIPPVYQRLMVV